jgi:hypothetical protein
MEGKLDKIKVERSITWERFTWFEKPGTINDSWLKTSQLIESSKD